jgi:hypothetical protein
MKAGKIITRKKKGVEEQPAWVTMLRVMDQQ